MAFQTYWCHFPSQSYNNHYLDDMKEAIAKVEPYSWIRIGDGELAFLEQEYVLPLDQILQRYGWGVSTNYCGSKLPNIQLRDRLIEAIKYSSMIGIFQGDPPTMKVLEKINIAPTNINYAFDNVFLPMNAKFVNMLLDKKIILIGRNSEKYSHKMKEILNIDTVANIPIEDYSQIDSCIQEVSKYDFNLALVSAGVNAKVICHEAAKRYNRCFLDMGHAWDNAFHPPGSYDEYFLIPIWQDQYYQTNSIVISDHKLYKQTCPEVINSHPSVDSRWLVIEDNL